MAACPHQQVVQRAHSVTGLRWRNLPAPNPDPACSPYWLRGSAVARPRLICCGLGSAIAWSNRGGRPSPIRLPPIHVLPFLRSQHAAFGFPSTADLQWVAVDGGSEPTADGCGFPGCCNG